MARLTNQDYRDRLAFVLDRRRIFDASGYNSRPSTWTKQQKAQLSRAWNEAVIATSSGDLRDYAEMVKRLRPFTTGFSSRDGYNLRNVDNWTLAQKRKVTRYFKKAVDLASKQFTLYRSNNKQQMQRARALANQKGYPGFHSIFYPAPPGSKIRYDKKRNVPVVKNQGIRSVRYYWEDFGYTPEDVAEDVEGVISDIINQVPENRFAIIAGEYAFGKGVPQIFPAEPLIRQVSRLTARYSQSYYDSESTSSSYYGNWLLGLEAWTFDRRDEFDAYRRAVIQENKERRLHKKKLRKQLRKDQKLKRLAYRLSLFYPRFNTGEFLSTDVNTWGERKKRQVIKAYEKLVSDVGLKTVLEKERLSK